MGQTTNDIMQEVERARSRLGQDLNELEYRVRSEFDWRVQFDRYPWVFISAAFGLAMLVGMAVTGGTRLPERAFR
jgi:hypothetical protein